MQRIAQHVMAVCALAAGCRLLLTGSGAQAQGQDSLQPEPRRVAEIAPLLTEKPQGLGRPIDEREHWDELATSSDYVYFQKSAGSDLDTPIPRVTEEIFRRINQSGSRPEWYALDRDRSGRFRRYVLAECLENKGRFLPRIEQGLDTFFSERTWYIPLHKARALANFEGRQNGIDLHKSMRSWEIALTDWLLGSRLRPDIRTRLRENLERRTLNAFRAMILGEQQPDWWLNTTNNWNAVCLSGVVGTALTMVESRDERAFIVAAAEKHVRRFLSGFPADGYCTEGLGYWNFGFGHYVAMTECVYQATAGQLDMLDVPNIRNIALFGARIEIMNSVYPAIADCSPNPSPSVQILYYTSRRLGLGLSAWDNAPLGQRASGNLYQTLINIFPNSADAVQPAVERTEAVGERSYFDSMGILICRPGVGSTSRLGACMKGGHNAEHHNHNDVGTFIVAAGAETPILDIGAEVYTNNTFSAKRYTSDALNSFGHSTPVVAGQLQQPGRAACARVVKADFSAASDTFVLDLRAPYDVPDLETLERTFVYSREGAGALTVIDNVSYTRAQTFEVALLTLGHIAQLGPHSLLLYAEREAVRADVEAIGGAVAVRIEPISAELRGGVRALRAGIAFTTPVKQGTITVRITPAEHPHVDGDCAVLNGGFEQEFEHWKVARTGSMTTLSTEQAASGKCSMKVVDTSATQGSSAFSSLFRMVAGQRYELRGKSYGVSGDGLGVITRFYNQHDRQLDLPDDQVRLAGTVFLGGTEKRWTPFAKSFTAPAGTQFGRVWIHSLNAATVEAYLDDLEVVEVEK